ncbi:hypothetical protein [Noviherbaspirillum aerium]|uniref:hypothetical protein n=1 Tax=Noviherbaspirillum aerium TaxID=2588497 RepID=UPI00124C3533|nr:hypothetical protein [Noviherbaspirillum aerium]
MSTMNDFLNSDIQNIQSREAYLGYAKNVQSGQHTELELTGNAFNVRFLISGVHIENLWDENETIEIELDKFIQTVSEWMPKN